MHSKFPRLRQAAAWLALALLWLTAPAAWAAPADCAAPRLGARELFLRGSFNSWTLDDAQRFVYLCNRYELVTRVQGAHEFKVADADWSPDADFGGTALAAGQPQRLVPKGGALRYTFTGSQRFVLTMPTDATPPSLTVTDCPAPPPKPLALFLRGSMNNWAALDDYAFQWHCDGYYLNVHLTSRQEFKIADAAWTPASSFGAAGSATPGSGERVPLKDAAQVNLQFPFSGDHTVRVAFDGVNGAPTVTIGPKSFADPSARAVTDPVALSLRHDSRDLAHKSPFGAVPAGTEVAFALDALPGVTRATLVIEKRLLEGNQERLQYLSPVRVPLAMHAAGDHQRWSARVPFTDASVYGYWFEVEIGGARYVYQNNATTIFWTREKGANGLGSVIEMPASTDRIRRYRHTVYARDFKVPDWAADAIYYYIFPDRFRNGDPLNDPRPGVDRIQADTVEFHTNWLDKPWKPGSGDGSDAVFNNDFFGGDIAGIIDKLDYIRALGANTLYITPMFSAASNHKYDTADYKQIDPHFGTNDDFSRLTREAAQRGIRVIPDTSLNHTGSDSVYFDRFGNHARSGTVGAFAGGKIHPESPYASWYTFDPAQTDPDKQYKGWVGVLDLPETNKASQAFRDFAYRAPDSVMKTWLDRGAAGWRMDVAPWVPDDFWREWRSAIKQHRPDALTIAETWFDASKYFLGDMFDSTMNYIFRNAVLDYANGGKAGPLYANIELMREAYPPQAFHALMNLLSTHDQARALHVFGEVDGASAAQVAEARQKLRLAILFQMSFPGSPTIYYGDEVGVTGGDDPYNRATYPWADRGGRPDTTLLADVTRLVHLRRDHAVLRRGTLLAPLLVDDAVIVMARQLGATWALVATNNAAQPRTVTVALPEGCPVKGWKDLLDPTPAPAAATAERRITLTVPARFGTVLVSP